MTQTRTFLILAWLMVAVLLWMEWGKQRTAAELPAAPVPAATMPANTAAVPTQAVPGAPAPVAAAPAASDVPVASLRNDVLALELDGQTITRADLLHYPQTREPGSPPVMLMTTDPARQFTARSRWRGADGAAIPLQATGPAQEVALADGSKAVQLQFEGRNAQGVTLRRTYTLPRGSYALRVRDELANTGAAAWTGDIERHLQRIPPQMKTGFTNPEAFSLNGAAWYSPEEKYEKRKYPDFIEDGPLNQQVTGGWVGLSQHYVLGAWVPQQDQAALYTLGTDGRLYNIDAIGPRVTLAPGQSFASDATLWVGPSWSTSWTPPRRAWATRWTTACSPCCPSRSSGCWRNCTS